MNIVIWYKMKQRKVLYEIAICFTVYITNLIQFVEGFPLEHNNERFLTNEQVKFMQKFGYLQDGGIGEAQYSQSTIYLAVKTLQKYGGINETGIFDEETIKLMGKRRCGVKDIILDYNLDIRSYKRFKRYVSVKGWNKRTLTYYISNWNARLGKKVVETEIKKALDAWAHYSSLKFIATEDSSADIIIAFAQGHHGDSYPFDGQGGVLAHAFFPFETTFGGDMHFDDDENWSTKNDEGSTNFFTVAIHELGHVMGLAHSPVSSSIMFPYYRSDDSPLALDYDDIMGMYKLYIENRFDVDESNNPAVATTSTTTITHEATESNEGGESSTTHSYQYHITYEGDVETVDDHKKHDATHGLPSQDSADTLCKGDYDTITVLRQELFVFKGKKVWRLRSRQQIDKEYPVTIEQMFKMPNYVTKIDAAYERHDGNILLFSGNRYWTYSGNHFVGEPYTLQYYGIDDSVKSIDAVQLWPKNEKTYIYKDDYFWRFDDKTESLDPGYPKNMSRWRGIPGNINGVINWEGRTYFFKNLLFWRFDNTMIKASESYPLPVVQYWFGCPETEDMFQLVERYRN